MNIANFDEIELLDDSDKTWLRQINMDYAAVRSRLEHRQLLFYGDTWLGTAWTQSGTYEKTIFAFMPFTIKLKKPVTLTDITSGETRLVNGSFTTQAWHTYVMSPAPEEQI